MPDAPNSGTVATDIKDGIGSISFYHPKKNSLSKPLLQSLSSAIRKLGADAGARVVVLRSEGDGIFCAGASFSDLSLLKQPGEAKAFFVEVAEAILAMKGCPKPIIARVQGKAVGGGVGLVAACDYALALNSAAVRLSELELGIGPFVVGPVIERKIGRAAFAAMGLDTGWREAAWARQQGLYVDIFASVTELDTAVTALAAKLANGSVAAMTQLKSILWEGTENWDQLLATRAEISGRLLLSDFATKAIAAAGVKRSRR